MGCRDGRCTKFKQREIFSEAIHPGRLYRVLLRPYYRLIWVTVISYIMKIWCNACRFIFVLIITVIFTQFRPCLTIVFRPIDGSSVWDICIQAIKQNIERPNLHTIETLLSCWFLICILFPFSRSENKLTLVTYYSAKAALTMDIDVGAGNG